MTDTSKGYQDEYYNDQYYDQGTPAAGQQPQYGQGGYGFVQIQMMPSARTDFL